MTSGALHEYADEQRHGAEEVAYPTSMHLVELVALIACPLTPDEAGKEGKEYY